MIHRYRSMRKPAAAAALVIAIATIPGAIMTIPSTRGRECRRMRHRSEFMAVEAVGACGWVINRPLVARCSLRTRVFHASQFEKRFALYTDLLSDLRPELAQSVGDYFSLAFDAPLVLRQGWGSRDRRRRPRVPRTA